MKRRAGEFGLLSTVAMWIVLIGAVETSALAQRGLEIRFESFPDGPLSTAPFTEGIFPLELVLDDGTAEGRVGVDAAAVQQFLWFNQFTPGLALPFQVEEIEVLFPPGVNIEVGDEVDLVVYLDPDGDPTNGAQLLAVIPETIQVLDGSTFSVYSLAAPVLIEDPGEVLIGVIDRFVESGVDPSTLPAAIDTSATQNRSWLAVWSEDPPASPDLPPDSLIELVDARLPGGGNWMIRGFGGPAPPVPTIPYLGLVVLGAVLLLAAWQLARRRMTSG